MNRLHFGWDRHKNVINRNKHGVPFEEAQSVFYDDSAVEFYDDEHSLFSRFSLRKPLP